jgi:hypothetical protein
MKTYSANALAETLERDRGTMLRALRNVPPDADLHGKPQWKVATAAKALAVHTGKGGSGNSAATAHIDPRLQRHYDAFERADTSMRRLKTVEARRQAAINMGPQISLMDKLQRQVSIADGHSEELTDLRADKLFMLYLRGFEAPCAWSMSEVWAAVDARD